MAKQSSQARLEYHNDALEVENISRFKNNTKTMNSSQTSRLIDYLKARPWQAIPAPELAQAASETGWGCLSFSRRIFEARKALQSEGHDLVKVKDEWHGGQRQTAYKFVPKPDSQMESRCSSQCFQTSEPQSPPASPESVLP